MFVVPLDLTFSDVLITNFRINCLNCLALNYISSFVLHQDEGKLLRNTTITRIKAVTVKILGPMR